jgi:hypothetical protein
MFVIRKEMMEVFEAHMREQFIQKTLAQLQQVFPEAAQRKGPPALRALIESGMEKAATYQILSEREVMLFIDLMMELGPDFLQQPKYKWIETTLQKPDFDERQKIDTVYRRFEAMSPKS